MSRAVGFEINDEAQELIDRVRSTKGRHSAAVEELSAFMEEMRLTGRVFIEAGDQVCAMDRVPDLGQRIDRWIVRYVDPEGEVVLVENLDSTDPPYVRFMKMHARQLWLVGKGTDGRDRSPRGARVLDGGPVGASRPMAATAVPDQAG